jgi:hypothetical protein
LLNLSITRPTTRARTIQFWNVNRPSVPGLGANECVSSGKWRKSTAFRQFRIWDRAA